MCYESASQKPGVWTRLIETELELSDHRTAAALAYYLAPRFLSPSLCLSLFPQSLFLFAALDRLSHSSLCTANEQRARFRDAAKGATSLPLLPAVPLPPRITQQRRRERGTLWWSAQVNERARGRDSDERKRDWGTGGQTLVSLGGGEGWTVG